MTILSYSSPSSRAPRTTGRHAPGALAGTRVVLQPNLSVRGWPAEAGSRALTGFIAPEDATVVERLRAAGARLVGASRMSELGLGLREDTTAAAVVEGLADVALMIDTMGEARAAAAGAGLFAFKPSWGLVSRYGLNGLVPSMECLAVLAASPERIGAVLEVIAGSDERDFSMPEDPAPDPRFASAEGDGEPLRVLAARPQCLSEAAAMNYRSALQALGAAGLEVREVELPDLDLLRAAHQVIAAVEASSACGRYDGVRYGHRTREASNWNEMYLRSRGESFGALLKALLFQGAYFQFENYPAFENACRIRGRCLEELAALFGSADALVLPAPRAAASADAVESLPRLYEGFTCAVPASLAGLPAAVLPGLGLQLVGPRLSDARLLAAARLLASAGWSAPAARPAKGGR